MLLRALAKILIHVKVLQLRQVHNLMNVAIE